MVSKELRFPPKSEFFFKKHNPFGYIIFARNLKKPEQIKNLNQELREISSNPNIPILIDQEGGRVARLKPPHFRKSLPAGVFFKLAKRDLEEAKKAVYINSRLMAHELVSLGINVDCAPVVDILFPESNEAAVGNRAFGDTPEMVATLATEMCRGFQDGGIIPVIKHIPGHGRAKSDSHHHLPVVDATLKTLETTDFAAFRLLNKMPWAMTAHITYTAIDEKNPATLSRKVIDMIRKDIGFEGLLLTDDISMKALSGSFASRCKQSLAAGCDVILHCNGKMEEMEEIAANVPSLSAIAMKRLERGGKFLQVAKPRDDFSAEKWEKKLAELVGE